MAEDRLFNEISCILASPVLAESIIGLFKTEVILSLPRSDSTTRQRRT